MTDFSFTGTATCQYCGAMLGASDEECDDCTSSDRDQHVFRKTTNKDETIMVEAVPTYKWQRLQEAVDDWTTYEWVGPRSSVQTMTEMRSWDSISDVPTRQMAIDVSELE